MIYYHKIMFYFIIMTVQVFGACGGSGDNDDNNNIDNGRNDNAITTYTVTYKPNGADSGTVPVDTTDYEQGATVTILDNTGSLVKTGYIFKGWCTTADDTGISYTLGQTFMMGSANVTLYAKWKTGSAPSISNLLYSPASTTVGSGSGTITVTGSVDFVDNEGDISTLIIDVFDSADNQIKHYNESTTAISGQTSSTVSVSLNLDTSLESDFTFQLYLLDTSNLKSNILTGNFSVKKMFQSGLDFTTGYSHSVALGDIDGDDDPDLAVANYASNTVSVFLNNGDGTFADKADYGTLNSPKSVAVGDIDGDDILDLTVANYYSNAVSVFLNNGDGTFSTRVDYVTGRNPSSVVVGDLDNDDDLDMAIANHGSNTVSVLLNNGEGTFAAKLDYVTGNGPSFVAVGDLDNDNYLDLALTTDGSHNVSVLLNNRDGTFATKMDYITGLNSFSMSIGDLDDDDDLDLAVTNWGSVNFSVLLNDGDGTFITMVNYRTGHDPLSIVVGDLDNDNDLDLAMTNGDDTSITVFLNNLFN